MTTKKSRENQVSVDELLTRWRADEAASIVAIERKTALQTAFDAQHSVRPDSNARLDLIKAEVEMLEAQSAELRSRAAAGAAIDAAEMESGDALAAATDPRSLRASLAYCFEELERRRLAYEESVRGFWTKIAESEQAFKDLSMRRQQTQLPPPRPRPQPSRAIATSPLAWLDMHAKLLSTSPDPVANKGYAIRLERLRIEERDIRAYLEEERIAVEKRAADATQSEKRRAEGDAYKAKARAQEEKQRQAESDAEEDRINQLAEAHRARERGFEAEPFVERSPAMPKRPHREKVVDGASGALIE